MQWKEGIQLDSNASYKRTGKGHFGISLALFGIALAVTDLRYVLVAFGVIFLASSICLCFFSADPGPKWKRVLDRLLKLAMENMSLLLGFSALALGVKAHSPFGALVLYLIFLGILLWDVLHNAPREAAALEDAER